MAPPETTTSRASETRPGSKGTILIIDAEPLITELLAETLQSLGYSTVGFTDRTTALEYFRQHAAAIDLVILDLAQPFSFSRAVIGELCRIGAGIPVLVASGYGDVHAEEMLQAGAAGIVQKPYSVRSLNGWISVLLRLS